MLDLRDFVAPWPCPCRYLELVATAAPLLAARLLARGVDEVPARLARLARLGHAPRRGLKPADPRLQYLLQPLALPQLLLRLKAALLQHEASLPRHAANASAASANAASAATMAAAPGAWAELLALEGRLARHPPRARSAPAGLCGGCAGLCGRALLDV